MIDLLNELTAQGEALRAAADAFVAGLHPNLAGVDVLQAVSVAALSWLGCRAIAGRHGDAEGDGDDGPTGPRVSVREATRLAEEIRNRR